MKNIHSIIGVSTLVLSAMIVPLLTGCESTGEDRYTQGTKESPRLVEKQFRFKGTVLYHHHGDYYSILADSGDEYYPLNLDPVYRKAGLRLQVHGESRGYSPNGRMRAIDIYDAVALSPLK